MSVEPSSLERDGSQQNTLSLISNEMVRLYKEQFGRGPTKTARTGPAPTSSS